MIKQYASAKIGQARAKVLMLYLGCFYSALLPLQGQQLDLALQKRDSANIALQQKDNVRAAQLYFDALAYAQRSRSDTLYAALCAEIGDLYLYYSNFPKAIEFYQKGSEQTVDPVSKQRLKLKIGRAQSSAQQFTALAKTLTSLSALLNENSAPLEYIQLLLLQSELEIAQRNYAQAQQSLLKAQRVAQKHQQTALSLQVLTRLSALAAQTGDVASALDFTRERLRKARTLKDDLQINTSILQYAQLLLAQNQLDSALALNEQLLAKLPRLLAQDTLPKSIWKQRSLILERKGRTVEAFAALDSLYAISSKESDAEKGRQLLEELTISRAEQELKSTYQSSLERQKNARFFLWIAGALFGVLGLFVGLRTWQKQRANLLLQAQNQKIETQKKELEQLSQLKNRLFAIVSHDLRSPLLSLEVILDTLDEIGYTEPKRQWWLDKLQQQTTKTNVLLENLLCWATLQMKHQPSEKKWISLLPLVREIKETAQLMYLDKRATISLAIPENLGLVQDEEMLRMAIRNLLINAIKFSDTGQEINISAWKAEHKVHICIQDQGIGMTEAQLQQALGGGLSRAGTKGETGSGIGLSLVRQFIEQEGGSLLGASAPNAGTHFTIVFAESIQNEV